jgi:hypothetical protein
MKYQSCNSSSSSSSSSSSVKEEYHDQNRNNILGIRGRQSPHAPKPILPQQPRRPTLDVRHLRHFEQIVARACLQPVAHVVQHNGEHAPAHSLAEFYHARCKAVAGLRQGLHDAARNSVAAGYGG